MFGGLGFFLTIWLLLFLQPKRKNEVSLAGGEMRGKKLLTCSLPAFPWYLSPSENAEVWFLPEILKICDRVLLPKRSCICLLKADATC